MFYVYVLKSKNYNHFYIGQTNNLEKRVEEHNRGNIYWTNRYAPWSVIYKELVESREGAVNREKYFKSHAGRNWLKKNASACSLTG